MRVTALAASAALALAGCVSYAPPAREPAAFVRQFESRRLDDPHLVALVARDRGDEVLEWNLDTLTRAAIYLSPDLEAARAKWRVSRAAVETAGRRPNPTLDASVGRATNPPAGDSPRLADVALGLRIETAGKRAHRIAQAEALSESDRLELRTEAWKLRARIRDALLDWKAAADEAAVLERQAAVDRSIARMLERRVEAGEIAMGEKVRADAALSRAELDLAAAASRETDAQSRLARAVGLPVAAIAEARIAFDGLDEPMPVPGQRALRADVLGRDDVRAAMQRFTAADAGYRLELARQYPDVELGPSYAYDTGTNKIAFGVMSLTLPVLDRNAGPIAEARARRDEAAARLEALQASMLAELDRARAEERDARERITLSRAILRREREQLDATSRRFAAGEEDRLSVASAQSAVHGAERASLAATLALQKAVGKVEDAARIPLFTAAGPGDSATGKGASR